ncbi:hypothetical protein B1A_13303, partial [mine drainage metagenome]
SAEFGYLVAYALYNHYPTVYLDLGASWGTQWWNFYQIGFYGEGGVYTGNIYQDGYPYYYDPLQSTYGFNAMAIHYSNFNPYAQPPW